MELVEAAQRLLEADAAGWLGLEPVAWRRIASVLQFVSASAILAEIVGYQRLQAFGAQLGTIRSTWSNSFRDAFHCFKYIAIWLLNRVAESQSKSKSDPPWFSGEAELRERINPKSWRASLIVVALALLAPHMFVIAMAITLFLIFQNVWVLVSLVMGMFIATIVSPVVVAIEMSVIRAIVLTIVLAALWPVVQVLKLQKLKPVILASSYVVLIVGTVLSIIFA